MACCLNGVKSLSEPMMEYCLLDPWAQTSVKSYSQFINFHSRKCVWKCCLENGGHLVSASMCYTTRKSRGPMDCSRFRHWSDTFTWNQCKINVDPRVFAIWNSVYNMEIIDIEHRSDFVLPDFDLTEKLSSTFYIVHWGWDIMATIYQTTYSITITWMKMFEFWLKFHWSLFLRVQLRIFQHWLR